MINLNYIWYLSITTSGANDNQVSVYQSAKTNEVNLNTKNSISSVILCVTVS